MQYGFTSKFKILLQTFFLICLSMQRRMVHGYVHEVEHVRGGE